MQEKISDRETRRKIFQQIKPYFKQKLGKFTHQNNDDDWHFISLGFVREEMTYVFGINMGFFKKDDLKADAYTDFGMNVLVRTNGENIDLRKKYNDFFAKYLADWTNRENGKYTSFRGGAGTEYIRMKKISEFKTCQEMIDFLKDSIDKLSEIYKHVAPNPESIFSHVVRAAPPWHDTILEIALDHLSYQS